MENFDSILNNIITRTKGKKIVIIPGNFNVVHTGHQRLFKFAKIYADKIVVAINKDMKGITFYTQTERYENIKNINSIDFCIPIKSSINELIKTLKPSFLIKGNEYQNQYNKEEKILKKYGGKLIFFSSSLTNEQDEYINYKNKNKNKNNFNIPLKFIKNHSINISNIKKKLNKFSKLKVLIIGDTIIDEYTKCFPLGMSREDSKVVYNSLNNVSYLGGAALVALNAKKLNAKTTFITLSGDDEYHNYIVKILKKEKIKSKVFKDKSRKTIVKKRFVHNNNVLFRLSILRDHIIEKKFEDEIINHIKKNNYDLIAISDFNYGLITNKIICEIKKKKSLRTADSQISSQFGDIKKFTNFHLITPTEHEARTSLNDNQSGLVKVAQNIQNITKNKNVILTLGDHGILINTKSKNKMYTDQIKALNNYPNNISGAGDCFFITCSLAITATLNIWESSLLASIASACHVSKEENTPNTIDEIVKILDIFKESDSE